MIFTRSLSAILISIAFSAACLPAVASENETSSGALLRIAIAVSAIAVFSQCLDRLDTDNLSEKHVAKLQAISQAMGLTLSAIRQEVDILEQAILQVSLAAQQKDLKAIKHGLGAYHKIARSQHNSEVKRD